MKVVFMEEVEGTARVGEVKNVADGFARNYLLPRRLAAPATDHYIAIAEARAEKDARRQTRLDDEVRTHLVPKMEGSSVTIEVRVGEQAKLFGSVTAREIAEALQQATGVELEHRQVDLPQPIRELGSREVTVKLTRNVHVQVTVNVEPLGGMPEPEEAEAVAEEAEAGPAAEEPEAEAAAEETEGEEEPVGETPAEEQEAEAEAVAEEPEAEAAAEETEAEEEPVGETPAEEAEAEAEPAAEEPEAEAAAAEEAEVEEEPVGETPAEEQEAEAEPAAEEPEAEATEAEETEAGEESAEEAEAEPEPGDEAQEGGEEKK